MPTPTERVCDQCGEPAPMTAKCPTCPKMLCEHCGVGDDRRCLRCSDRKAALRLSGEIVTGSPRTADQRRFADAINDAQLRVLDGPSVWTSEQVMGLLLTLRESLRPVEGPVCARMALPSEGCDCIAADEARETGGVA